MNNSIIWPYGKKAAGMITIDLDAELFWTAMDESVKDAPATLSLGKYGMKRGLDRMLVSLAERNLKATFFIPGMIAEKYPDQIRAVAEAGHEISFHGYSHENYGLMTDEQQQEDMRKGLAAIEGVTGKKPIGFRIPEGNMTPSTLEIAAKNGLIYDSSMLDDDLPYGIDFGEGLDDFVEIPMHWELHDLPYFAFNYIPLFPYGECRVARYSDVLDNWLTELKGYVNRGFCYVIKFDPQSIGNPTRIQMFEKVLDEMMAADMWIATGSEIAAWYNACK